MVIARSRTVCGSSRLAVMGLSLCLLLLLHFVSPAVSAPFGEVDMPSDVLDSPDNQSGLLRFLRSAVAYERMREAARGMPMMIPEESQRVLKRGFGFAGLDNVDMITSTLDRSRSRPRSRQRPQMSVNVGLDQLRALMAKAG